MKSKKMFVAISFALLFILSFSVLALADDYISRYSNSTLKRSSTVKVVVKNVQADLTKNTNFSLVHDGIFGSNTYYAARQFQGNMGLTIDGEVGYNTKTALYPLLDTNYFYH